MPIQSRRSDGGERTIPVEFEGETAKVTYAPGRYDYGRKVELGVATSQEQWQKVGEHIVAVLADMLVSWEIVDARGNPEPITLENMQAIGRDNAGLLSTIWGAIRAEGNQPRTNAETSGATLPQVAPLETATPAPGGISSSEPPIVSIVPRGNWTAETGPQYGASGQ